MGKLLQQVQTAAADRSRFAEHPRLYRVPAKPKRDWVDLMFTWGLFGWFMWAIWAPVALGALVLVAVLL